MYKHIVLKPGREDSLMRFHPWVFSGAIKHLDNDVAEGEVVRVLSSDGTFLAVGHYQEGSIAVRVLSFRDVPIDDNFWYARLSSALEMRRAIGVVGSSSNNTYRLIHGEGDNMPGLIIDVYDDTAVMQAHSIGMHIARRHIAGQLLKVMPTVKNVYYKSETTLPFLTDDEMKGFLTGGSTDNIAKENGLLFHVDWMKGQKTGFFVDQRENRSLVERMAAGRRVLNMFCYTGGFSVYAMRGGAALVHSVDSSEKAIELTKANVELNFPGDSRHAAFCEDAFRFLDRNVATDGGKYSQYDLVILDPPAFAKHKGALHNALKGYTRLNQKAFEKIRQGGILFTFSCSQVVTKEHFRNAVFTAAALANRKVRILYQLHQPADHPVNIYHPEGEYLKGLVLYVE